MGLWRFFRRSWRAIVSLALVLTVLAAELALQWPIARDFKLFAFYDPGSALRSDQLLEQGLRPGVDFAYSYGLLSLEIAHQAWRFFGRTPQAYLGCYLLGALVLALGLWQLLRQLAVSFRGMIFLAVALPYAIMPYSLNPTHLLEAITLSWALVFQARRRYAAALVLATLCLLIKPSMAYFYGLFLVVMLGFEAYRRRDRWVIAGPAAAAGITALLGAAFLVLRFGWQAWLATQFPMQARASYRAANFGFFRAGLDFWHPRGHDLGYYLQTEAGAWICASILLLGGGLVWALGAVRDLSFSRRAEAFSSVDSRELIGTLALLHGVFIFLLYAWAGSWNYYSYLLAAGAALVFDRLLRGTPAAAQCVALVLMVSIGGSGLQNRMGTALDAWRSKVRDPMTQGLWAYQDQIQEWQSLSGVLPSALLLTNGFTGFFAPQATSPRAWFLSPKLATPREIAAIREQLQRAVCVVRLNELGALDPWFFPEWSDLLGGYRPAHQGRYFTVMVKDAAAIRPPL